MNTPRGTHKTKFLMARQAQCIVGIFLLAQCILGSGGYFPTIALEFKRSIDRKRIILTLIPLLISCLLKHR